MHRWDAQMAGLLNLCETRGLSVDTIKARRYELMKLGAWLRVRRPKVNLEKVDDALMVKYFQSRGVGRSKATLASVITICRNMGEYLVEQNIWLKNPLRWIRGPKICSTSRLPKVVGPAQMKQIWDAAVTNPMPSSRPKLVTMLALLYGTGIRRGELSRLRVADWDREKSTIRIDGQKTNRERVVCVGPGVWRCIEAYLPHRHNQLEKHGKLDQTSFFISRDGYALSAENMGTSIRALCQRAGVPEMSMHKFRHCCASDLLEKGVPLPDVQNILGHSHISNTTRYTHIVNPEKAKAMEKHPVNQFLRETEEQKTEAL